MIVPLSIASIWQ